MEKIIYVPLDERNCNHILPGKIASAAGFEAVRPDGRIIGKQNRQGGADDLWDWLFENAPGCKYAVLSLDMLIYGGLVCSRRHFMDTGECLERLERIRKLKEANPGMELFVYMLVMRTSNSNDNSEEPEFWALHGKDIWSLSYLSDKKARAGLDESEQKKLELLGGKIPEKYIKQYLDRRKVNLAVSMQALQILKDGDIAELVIAKDDNSEYGYSTKDSEALLQEVARLGIGRKVMIYPGTDEVACTLTARIINRAGRRVPRVYVCYSSTLGPQIIAKYEDRPINESIKCQIISAGCAMADSSAGADIVLMANTPGNTMAECFEQSAFHHGYSNFRNLREFAERLKYYANGGKLCAVADIAYCNGSDNELVGLMLEDGLLDKIFAYGGWNTAANTLGVVIAQAVAAHSLGIASIKDSRALYEIHMYKIIEDWAYQANVMNEIVTKLLARGGVDCYALGGLAGSVAEEIRLLLNKFLEAHRGSLGKAAVTAMRLPWGRTFDIDFDLTLE